VQQENRGKAAKKQRQYSKKTGRQQKGQSFLPKGKEKRQNKNTEERRKIGSAQRTMKTAKQKTKKSYQSGQRKQKAYLTDSVCRTGPLYRLFSAFCRKKIA